MGLSKGDGISSDVDANVTSSRSMLCSRPMCSQHWQLSLPPTLEIRRYPARCGCCPGAALEAKVRTALCKSPDPCAKNRGSGIAAPSSSPKPTSFRAHIPMLYKQPILRRPYVPPPSDLFSRRQCPPHIVPCPLTPFN